MLNRRTFVRLLSAVPFLGYVMPGNTNSLPVLEQAEKWSRFTQYLGEALADLEEGEYSIVTTRRTWYYVQFAAEGRGGMRMEAVSNTYTNSSN